MASTAPQAAPPAQRALHPLHQLLLFSAFPLWLGALLNDWAYSATGEVQWLNFAAWLIAGALLFAGGALAWAIIALFAPDWRHRARYRLYVVLLASTFVTGFINALVHARDAWASMAEGLVLSALTLLLMLAALWFAIERRSPEASQ